MRYVFKRLAEAFEILIQPERYLRLDDDLTRALQDLVVDSRVSRWRSIEAGDSISARKIAMDVIRFGMEYQWASEENARAWDDLTPREQDVAALVCLGYTNQQIAQKLVIAPNTVKTHIRHVLRKFQLHGKLELKGVLRGSDFSGWAIWERE
jgi:DNA-binding NarL/FixJ family response regulator